MMSTHRSVLMCPRTIRDDSPWLLHLSPLPFLALASSWDMRCVLGASSEGLQAPVRPRLPPQHSAMPDEPFRHRPARRQALGVLTEANGGMTR